MLLQSSKNLHSTAAELRFCSRRAPHRRSHRSRHRKHVPPPDGPALGHGFRIGPDGMGGGGPSAGSVVFERNGLGGHQLVVLPVGTVLLHYYPKVLQTSTNRSVTLPVSVNAGSGAIGRPHRNAWEHVRNEEMALRKEVAFGRK